MFDTRYPSTSADEPIVKSAKSLRGKFITTMLLVTGLLGLSTLVIVVLLSARTSSEHLATVRLHIEDGIRSKGRVLTENHALAMRTMALDNAFLDIQRLVERAVKEDTDLVYGLYVNSEKEAIAFCERSASCSTEKQVDKQLWKQIGFTDSSVLASAPTVVRASRLGVDLLEVAMPVLGDEKEIIGTVRYGLSTQRMHDALAQAKFESHRQLQHSLGLIGSVITLSVMLALALSRFQAGRITQPLSELTTAAHALAAGNRSVRVDIASGDEIQTLGASFNRMVEDLASSYEKLEEMNRTLEQKVQIRTAELAEKNRDMRLVLDNVDQGFVTLNAAGTMAIERSRVVDEWFGRCSRTMPFWDFMSNHAPEFASAFHLAWDQVTDGILPTEVAIDQLPQRLTVAHRVFSCRYLPLYRDDEFDGTLLVLADVTEKLAKEREEGEQDELMQAFKRLMLDRSGFLAFHRDGSSMVESISSKNRLEPIVLKRTLHTLKGNSAVMGLMVVARICHQLEDQLADNDAMLPETVAELVERWDTITEHITVVAGLGKPRMIEVPQTEYSSMITQLASNPAAADILSQLTQWQLEPVERAFERLAEQSRALAKRLGKCEVSVVMEGNGVRLDGDAWAPFFSSLVHVIRNAIDHGFESTEERVAARKPANGTLRLRAELSGNALSFEISDDGRGIDWTAVAEKARAFGLPHQSPKDLSAALLHDGVTTSNRINETSGRGIGLSAVRQRVEAMNGTIEPHSNKGRGTTWIIRFPLAPNSGFALARRQIPPPRTALRSS